MKRVLSGIQPTGNLHLGNYLGAIRNWIGLQDQYDCYFMMVDLHALTTQPDPETLRKNTLEGAALYMACGIDPQKCAIFPQSWIPAHTELMWVLSCFTPLGWLNRMTQFKEKSGDRRNESVLGLYSYPVLMAADILLYGADFVPVGDDQKQHVELTRDLALSLNTKYARPLFKVPEPLILGPATRVMSLKDGLKKMSKSDAAVSSRIGIFDEPDILVQKIKKARTDSDPFPESITPDMGRPEVLNLISIYAALTQISQQEICNTFRGGNFAPFKEQLAEALVQALDPIRKEFLKLMGDESYVFDVLKQGAHRAEKVAQKTLQEFQQTVGLLMGNIPFKK